MITGRVYNIQMKMLQVFYVMTMDTLLHTSSNSSNSATRVLHSLKREKKRAISLSTSFTIIAYTRRKKLIIFEWLIEINASQSKWNIVFHQKLDHPLHLELIIIHVNGGQKGLLEDFASLLLVSKMFNSL